LKKLISATGPKVVTASSQNQVNQAGEQVSNELENLRYSNNFVLLFSRFTAELQNVTRRENASKKLLIEAHDAAKKERLKMDLALIQAKGFAERESNSLNYIGQLQRSLSNGKIEWYRLHVQLHDMKQELTQVRAELAAALGCKQKTS
jgi:hypothetical protein